MSGSSDRRLELADQERQQLSGLVGATAGGDTDGQGLRVAIAAGAFNGGVTARLVRGALAGLAACGVDRADTCLAWAPGAFELPLVARAFAGRGVDAVICLGAVIRGETGHYDFVAGECAAGLQRVQLDSGRPVIFGVLTTDTVDQALERSVCPETPDGGGGQSQAGSSEEAWSGNKGFEAARTAVEMVRLLRSPTLERVAALTGSR